MVMNLHTDQGQKTQTEAHGDGKKLRNLSNAQFSNPAC
jgi:hypothetical protein